MDGLLIKKIWPDIGCRDDNDAAREQSEKSLPRIIASAMSVTLNSSKHSTQSFVR